MSERDFFPWVVSSGMLPKSRDNVSGTTCSFPGLFDRKIKILQSKQHVGRVLHVYRCVRTAWSVTHSKVLTPKVRSPVLQSKDNSTLSSLPRFFFCPFVKRLLK